MLIYVKSKDSFFLFIDAFQIIACIYVHYGITLSFDIVLTAC